MVEAPQRRQLVFLARMNVLHVRKIGRRSLDGHERAGGGRESGELATGARVLPASQPPFRTAPVSIPPWTPGSRKSWPAFPSSRCRTLKGMGVEAYDGAC